MGQVFTGMVCDNWAPLGWMVFLGLPNVSRNDMFLPMMRVTNLT